MKIKQEKHDQSDDQLDSKAHIKQVADPDYVEDCDSIKIEEVKISEQDESDWDTHRHKYIQNEGVLDTEELDNKIESMSTSTPYGSVLHRIKDEHSAEHGDEVSLSTDAVKQTKLDVVPTVKVESEKLEGEIFVAGTKFENMDALGLNEELDIKSEIDLDTVSDSPTDRIKDEHMEEQGDQANLSTDAVEETKMEDLPAVELKHEKEEEKPWIDSAKYENMDTLELNEELDIKSEDDLSTMSDSAPTSAAEKKKWRKKQEAAHVEGERKMVTCYNCNYTARCITDLIIHLKLGNCSLRTGLNKSRSVHTRRHPLNKHVCIECNKVFAKRIYLDDHVIKKHVEYIASVSSKIHKCGNCDYKTTVKNNLVTHMVTHTGAVKLITCNHCNLLFKRKQSLDDHILKEHPSFAASVTSKFHECIHCSYKTTFAGQLAKHMMKHNGKIEKLMCANCDASFINKQSLDDHILKKHPSFAASVTSKFHECIHCSYKNVSRRDLAKHMMRHGKIQKLMCANCDASFRSKRSLDDHILKKHPIFAASVTSKIHECVHCSYKTVYPKDLAKHMMKHGKIEKLMCANCDASFINKRSLDDHILKKHPNFAASVSSKIRECINCSYKTIFPPQLAKHMMKHNGKIEKLMCSNCDASFRSKQCLDDHILKKHPSFAASVTSKFHECIHCSYKTISTKDLAKHTMKHGKIEKLMCANCDASFINKQSLDDHILKKHPSFAASVTSKIHECVHCSYKTKSPKDLAKHMMKHGKIEKLMCANCDASFINKRSLDDHILKKHPNFAASVSSKIRECIHCSYKTIFPPHLAKHMMKHNGNIEKLMCSNCDASFRSKQCLDDHILKKHPSFAASVTSKFHECVHCSYKTIFPKDLAKHMMKHGKIEKLMCANCDASFINKQSLDDHILKKHPSFAASVTSKFHECIHCSYKTISPKDLAKHMMKHGNIEKLMCANCDASFINKQSLDDHILKKHPRFATSVTSTFHECIHCSYKTITRSDLAKHMMKHGKIEKLMCANCDASFINKQSLDDHILKKHLGFAASVTSKFHEMFHIKL